MEWQILLNHADAGKCIDLVWWCTRQGGKAKPQEFWCALVGRALSPDGKSDTVRELARLTLRANNFRDGNDWHHSAFDAEVTAIETPDGGPGPMTVPMGALVTVDFKNENVQDEAGMAAILVVQNHGE